ITGDANIEVGGSATEVVLSGDITEAGSRTLTKLGEGRAVLTGTNTFTGGVNINAGSLELDSDESANGGDIALASGTTLAANGTFTMSSNVAFNGASSFDVSSGTITVSGNVTDAGSAGMTKTGSGDLTISGDTTIDGPLAITGGALTLTGGGSLPAANGVTMSHGTTLNLSTSSATLTTAFLSGRGTVALGGNTLTVGNATDAATFSGNMTGSGSLVKMGSARNSINVGTSSYSGTIIVNGGELNLNGTLPSDVTVGSGAIFSGAASISSLTNDSRGTVSPGNSIGTITISGNYTQEHDAALTIELDQTSSSKLDVSGDASLNGSLIVDFIQGTHLKGKTYTIVEASNVSGTFNHTNLNQLPVLMSLCMSRRQ
ncbi:uncharacterized protein TRIADDRAFT_62951, partial [Trichoplax adhaerens]